jgi:hypothetical protein
MIYLIYSFICLVEPEIKPKALYMLGKCSATEPHSQSKEEIYTLMTYLGTERDRVCKFFLEQLTNNNVYLLQ